MSRGVVAILGLVLLGMVMVAGIQSAVDDTRELTEIEREGWTPDAGNVTNLSDSKLDAAIYDDRVAVYNDSGAYMSNSTDYDWYDGNGTIKALTGGELDGEPSASVSYNYTRPPAETRSMAEIATLPWRFIGLVFPLFLFVFLLMMVS